MEIKILTIPGYGGSGEDHWQTYWENEIENTVRVEQEDWDNPQLDLWVNTLDSYIQRNQEYVLVAHSLACALVAHWASKYESSSVIGALLVSTSDVDSSKHTPHEVRNFSPMPTSELPFKSIVVASDNDPYVSISRAEYFARSWGSEFVKIGSYGHINAESNLQSWPQGQGYLRKLVTNV
jgi:hypothetical protein